MSKVIWFKTRQPWDDEEQFARRVAEIVTSSQSLHEGVPFKNDEGRWTLDPGNDFWLRPDPKVENGWTLAYRYGHPESAAALDGLAVYLNWVFR